MPVTALVIGAGLGATKHFAIDKPAADRKRTLAAETTMYSPWTHLKGELPDDPNLLGTMMEGGAAGAQLGSSIQTANADSALKAQMGQYYGQGGPNSQANKYQTPAGWSDTNSNLGSFNGKYKMSGWKR